MSNNKKTTTAKLKTKKTPFIKLNNRDALAKRQKELDDMDIQSALKAFNDFMNSPDWIRYGCVLIPQGQFIGDKIKSSLVIVKSK
jgi:hypothetical protein